VRRREGGREGEVIPREERYDQALKRLGSII